jgi:hypothetical protein
MKKVISKLGKDVATLAYGEVTGHSHSIYGGTAELYNNGDKDVNLLRTLTDTDSELKHEDHATILIPGLQEAEVFIQEEYDPENEYRKVID